VKLTLLQMFAVQDALMAQDIFSVSLEAIEEIAKTAASIGGVYVKAALLSVPKVEEVATL
jgi:hypothetical protein